MIAILFLIFSAYMAPGHSDQTQKTACTPHRVILKVHEAAQSLAEKGSSKRNLHHESSPGYLLKDTFIVKPPCDSNLLLAKPDFKKG